MPDPSIPFPPEATITVYECDVCHRREFSYLAIRPSHWWRGVRCNGIVRERTFVDPAAVDREAWVAAIRAAIARHGTAWQAAPAVVDALLGPEDDRA